MRINQVSLTSLAYECKELEEEMDRFYSQIAFSFLSVLIFVLCAYNQQVDGSLSIIISIALLFSIIVSQILFFYTRHQFHYFMMPFNSLLISLLIFNVFSPNSQQAQPQLHQNNYAKEIALISLFLLDTHKLSINYLNLTALKVTEAFFFKNTTQYLGQATDTIQFSVIVILLMVIMYIKLYFFRNLFSDSEIGRDWIDIVNTGLSQKVFITKYNGQTGKLELNNCNQSTKRDIQEKIGGKSELQECFNKYLQNFKLNISDCLIYKPPLEIADKKNMIDLKQYLVNRHIYMSNQNSNKISLSRFSENLSFSQIPSSQKNIRQRNTSSQSFVKNNKRRVSNSKPLEQIQVIFKDAKSNVSKVYKMRINQFGISNPPQLIVILDDESLTQEITRYKQEKQTIEAFLFSLMHNIQEKLRLGIWGLENGSLQSVKVENYLLINQVYCIFDYFIIKAKKLRNNFNQPLTKKIQKILNVESFYWFTIVKELQELFSDLTFTSDLENEQSVQLIQDRRKVKQVLIALISLAQYRTVGNYELRVSKIIQNDWNALLFTITFQTDIPPKDYRHEFYKFLNGNAIDLLNQVEEEVIKEQIMLIGPYQINEEITDSGQVQIRFAFFEDLEVIYDTVTISAIAQTQRTNTTTERRDDTQIRNIKTPRNQEMLAATYDEYVMRIRDRQKRTEKRVTTIEQSQRQKLTGAENTTSNEDLCAEGLIQNMFGFKNENMMTSSADSIEKVQALPTTLSPKKMNNLTNPSLNMQTASSFQQLCQIQLSPSKADQKKINSTRSCTVLVQPKNFTTATPKSSRVFQKNQFNFGHSKTKIEDEDLTLRMQSSIYTAPIIQSIRKQSNPHSQLGSKITRKDSGMSLSRQATPLNIDKVSLSLCRQLSENKIEFATSPMKQFQSLKTKGQITPFNNQKSLSKFKTQEFNIISNTIVLPDDIQNEHEQNNMDASAKFIENTKIEYKQNDHDQLDDYSKNEKFTFSYKSQIETNSKKQNNILQQNLKRAEQSMEEISADSLHFHN